ncbi:MAG: division/cell wall cluster transcriptional repressor MraZ [Desulfobacterota bacterium]|nr:division/cell wall cluster transcriptional repressor MraZ [Thermodesulfobacteriota bacterium]MDW8001353.1 division/cell wall cluster transcriptional repressor MraZ [Deltaproteobacteria bacterium]
MFEGRYEYSLDDKNRVSIPAKFREVLARHYDLNLILTNLDGCIVAYPKKEWEAIKENISRIGNLKKEARTFLRFYFSGACECPIDRLGRILIPQSLKSYAKIEKQVVIIGMNKKIEIWSKERWDELVREVTSNFEKIVDMVSELGL